MMKTIKYISSALVLALALGSCGKDKAADESEEKEDIPVVKTMKVGEQDVDQLNVYTASVEPEVINNISAQMANRIKAIYVDEGVKVGKGQKLVMLDDVNTTQYELAVDNAKAALRNAQTNYDRAVELLKIGGGTQQSVDQMEVTLINAKNAVAQAERTLANSRENTVLTSPISGVVTARNYDPGDMTGALPILTVAQINPVKVVINVNESQLSTIHKGMPVDLTFNTYGDEVFKGTVSLVMPTVDAASRTVGVEITLPNGDGRVLPGMFGRATISHGQASHVVVPDRAVVKQQGSGDHYVYVLKGDGTVSYNKVELGQRIGTSYELISGVPAGSEVIVEGQNALTDGRKVQVIK
ncbi:MAG: efflux RND transporter periplasmic adaptor subunit [Muribaculaceae bacterium]|nr:efflux RND transporter periplasmic adaptor subunit [Muribaculaceae bacterium]